MAGGAHHSLGAKAPHPGELRPDIHRAPKTKGHARTAVAVLMLLAVISRADARGQGLSILAPREVSAGYAFSTHPSFDYSWPLGWFAGAGWPVSERIAVVGEVANHRLYENPQDFQSRLSMWSAMVGVTGSRPVRGPLTAFARGSAGITTLRFHIVDTAPSGEPFGFPPLDIALSITAPAVQLGGGIDVEISRRMSLRTLIEYRRIFGRRIQTLELPAQNRLNVSTGIAVSFGAP